MPPISQPLADFGVEPSSPLWGLRASVLRRNRLLVVENRGGFSANANRGPVIQLRSDELNLDDIPATHSQPAVGRCNTLHLNPDHWILGIRFVYSILPAGPITAPPWVPGALSIRFYADLDYSYGVTVPATLDQGAFHSFTVVPPNWSAMFMDLIFTPPAPVNMRALEFSTALHG